MKKKIEELKHSKGKEAFLQRDIDAAERRILKGEIEETLNNYFHELKKESEAEILKWKAACEDKLDEFKKLKEKTVKSESRLQEKIKLI